MTLSTISVNDMHCAGCVSKIERALCELEGVLETHINPARRQVLVEHADGTDTATLLARIEQAGFHPCLTSNPRQSFRQRDLLKRLGIAGLAMMQVMMAALAMYAGAFDGMDPSVRRLFEITSLAFCIPVVAYSAMPFFRNAIAAWRTGLNMDVPIALAIVCAFAVSLAHTLNGAGEVYYDSVVMFTFLLLTARYIDDRLKQRFDLSNAALAALPATGLVLEDNRRIPTPLVEIAAGSRLWVEQGNQVPLDGRVESAEATLDESVLTGESQWVSRACGEAVYAGTLNRGSGFCLRTSATYDSTRIAGIADLANRAQADKPQVAQLADRIAAIFVPAVLCLAALTFVAWQLMNPEKAFVAALTVLVVSCPCALSLATPAAITAAMTRLRQTGIVLTRSDALLQIAQVNAALFDKTGTLTEHAPDLVNVELLADVGVDRDALLDIAAALQRHANHPLARAFPEPKRTVVNNARVVAGAGVQGRWQDREVKIGSGAFCGLRNSAAETGIFLAMDGTPVARFEIADPLRPDAQPAIEALRRAGIRSTMVSGDAADRCAALATRLHIDYVARQAPETKLEITRALQTEGARVMVVGDGINDVPALAAADVSVAVLESSDLVKSRTDVLLLSRRLGALVDLVVVGRRAAGVIRQNLAWALSYNLVAIPFAALGFMPPWVAALGMASSSTLVMLNATRLLRIPVWRPPEERVQKEAPRS